MTTHTYLLNTPGFSFAVPVWNEDEDLPACRAAALYLAQRVEAPTFEKLSALLYLADREHLSRYGALMCGGHYEALRDGPTPSAFLRVARLGLDLMEVPDMEELTPAALGVLNEVITAHGQTDAPTLSALTRGHDWQRCPAGQPITAQDIARTLPNAPAVLEHLSDPHP